MSDTIHASNGSWSKTNDDHSRGAALDSVYWIERLVRLEERLSALTARFDKHEAEPSSDPEIIDILTEIGELLAQAVESKGEGESLADEIVRHPDAFQKIIRRGVLAAFGVVLFIISTLLEPGGAGFSIKFGG